jgi:hypothetical protein
MSEDQKPSCAEEAARIVEAGGYVTNNRIFGQLAVARAMGDRDLKEEVVGALTCEPEIMQEQLRANDEFIVVACDGLFDVMSNQQVVDFVRERIAKKEAIKDICSAIIHKAINELHSADNVSVVIVRLVDKIDAHSMRSSSTGVGSLAPPVRSEEPLITTHSNDRSNDRRKHPMQVSALSSLLAETDPTDTEYGASSIGGKTSAATAGSSSSSSSNSSSTAGKGSGGKSTNDSMDDDELMNFLMDDTNFD